MEFLEIIKIIRDVILLISIYFIYFMVGYYGYSHMELTSNHTNGELLALYYYMILVIFICLIITTYVLHHFRFEYKIYHIYYFNKTIGYFFVGIIWILMGSCGFLFNWLSKQNPNHNYHYFILGAYLLLIIVNYLLHYKYVETRIFNSDFKLFTESI